MAKRDSRLNELTKFISKNDLGIEVAPYFNPIAAKHDGYDCLILDVFDTQRLRASAAKDPNIPDDQVSDIEDVDIVGDASNIADLCRAQLGDDKVSYVVSSHNFEHLPNPIKFLRGCADVLKEGGILSMAIPDYRTCFDHFRFPTRLSDWLRAYHENKTSPAPERIFDATQAAAIYQERDVELIACHIDGANPDQFELKGNLKQSYKDYLSRVDTPFDYVDAHFSAMFNKTFELMIQDLIFLGLLDFEVLETSETRGHEFFVHLRKATKPTVSDAEYHKIRTQLLKDIQFGLGAQAFKNAPRIHSEAVAETTIKTGLNAKQLMRGVLGDATFDRLRAVNKERRRKRRRSSRPH